MAKTAKWRQFSRDYIEKIVNESRSYREVAQKLGYAKDSGGTQTSLMKMCSELNLDTSHFLGQAWNKENYNYDLFTADSIKKNGVTTLKPLMKLRGRQCECCGLTKWLDQEINLEIHHIDGNRKNNCLENLQLLCPNCHSYTENWRGRKKSVGGAPRQETP